MTRFTRFTLRAALLMCLSAATHADDMQEAGKLFKQGQAAQALTRVNNALARTPKDAQARLLKGVILSEQGQADEAAKIFAALTVDYPTLPEPYNNLAAIYAAQGQYDKAKTALEAALRTHPSYATAYENLGEIYAKMASQAYDKALQLDRSSSNSKTRLALLSNITPLRNKAGDSSTQLASAEKTHAAAPPAQPVAVAATETAVAASSPAGVKAEAARPADATAAAAPAQAAAKPATVDDAEVMKAVHDWAQAWSARNASKYLAMYAPEFKTPGGIPRKAWEQQRRERISKPQPISVTIINARVKRKDADSASVSFVQAYRSGSLKSTTRKTLEMIRANGNWLIRAEHSGA